MLFLLNQLRTLVQTDSVSGLTGNPENSGMTSPWSINCRELREDGLCLWPQEASCASDDQNILYWRSR